ncbi:hypothetical protein MAH48_14350 [Anoxybacillus flavithermus]|nr:hypothetical protein [Anoxybacillus flavithermus]
MINPVKSGGGSSEVEFIFQTIDWIAFGLFIYDISNKTIYNETSCNFWKWKSRNDIYNIICTTIFLLRKGNMENNE